MSTAEALAQLHLLRLASPALPVGAFHYSQGLEYTVEAGWLGDRDAVAGWIEGVAAGAIATLDVPLLLRMHGAWCEGDADAVHHLSGRLIAARESSELRAEDRAAGQALARLLVSLGMPAAERWIADRGASFAALFSLAAQQRGVSASSCAAGYLWAWCENQVLAAIKLVPLGQTAGQWILERLIPRIPGWVDRAHALEDDQIGISAVAQGIASMRHETQYSRLFRS